MTHRLKLLHENCYLLAVDSKREALFLSPKIPHDQCTHEHVCTCTIQMFGRQTCKIRVCGNLLTD
mgnify:CR=1 FL=1